MPRLQRTQLAAILTAIFGSLSPAALHELQTELEWRHIPSGHVLFQQGEPTDALYIVVNGRLRITATTQDRSQRILDEVSRGETIGGFGFYTGETRPASASAIRDTDVVRLSKASFDRLLEQYPHAMMQIAHRLIKRLQAQTTVPVRVASNVATFGVVPAGQDVPLHEFVQALVTALEAFGPTLHL